VITKKLLEIETHESTSNVVAASIHKTIMPKGLQVIWSGITGSLRNLKHSLLHSIFVEEPDAPPKKRQRSLPTKSDIIANSSCHGTALLNALPGDLVHLQLHLSAPTDRQKEKPYSRSIGVGIG